MLTHPEPEPMPPIPPGATTNAAERAQLVTVLNVAADLIRDHGWRAPGTLVGTGYNLYTAISEACNAEGLGPVHPLRALALVIVARHFATAARHRAAMEEVEHEDPAAQRMTATRVLTEEPKPDPNAIVFGLGQAAGRMVKQAA